MDVFGGASTQNNNPKPQNKPLPISPKQTTDKPKNNLINPVKKTKKIFGLDAKSVVAVVSIALFFVFSMAGVLISLQQRMNPEEVASPTAPKSKPAAAEIVNPPTNTSCSLSFNILEPSPSPTPTPTPSVSPSPSPSPTPTPTPSVSPSPTPSPTTYDCNSDCETNEQCESANADYICSTTYNNKCRLDSNPESETCDAKPEEYACNSTCTTNEQCQTASNDYICYQNNCRLDSNPSAENCQPSNYTPPVIGCNDACVNNADCDNPEHICYNNACRLATNPTSSTCSIAQTPIYQPTKGQPTLPEKLPQSGSNAILDWFKAGLGVMGIGAVLLLLL